jgi:signal transduction histidine kinase
VLGDDAFAKLRTDLLADGQPVPVVIVRDDRVHEANAAARAFFANARVGAALLDILDPRSMHKLAEFRSAGASGVTPELQARRPERPPVAMRFLLVLAPGEQWLVAHDAPGYSQEVGARLMAANNELAVLTRELTRRMHELEAAKEATQRLAELRELFIAALAHDLRAPLTVIQLSEAGLRGKASTPRAAELAAHGGTVERSIKRMLQLIDSLLLAAQLDTTDPRSLAESFDSVRVDQVAHVVADDLGSLAEAAGVRIVLAASEPVSTRGNRTWLAEVLSNLLVNAIRHSPKGASVELNVAGAGSEVRCHVADHGSGIPAPDREHVFERWVQRQGRRGSIGLGLYICRRIVVLHGGRIWVEDNDGGGARFVFHLPGTDTGRTPRQAAAGASTA